ncbi:MAG: hypothetical protein V4538_15015 [Bacteroidota bacterium]
MSKEILTVSQEIDIAMIKANLTQAKVAELLHSEETPMNPSKFSVKKKYNDFTDLELKGLNKILKTNF